MAHPELGTTAACVFDAYGMKAVWANRGGMVRPRLPGVPVAMIKTLDQLPALLGL